MVLQTFDGSAVSLSTINTKLGLASSTPLGSLRGVNSFPASGAISLSQGTSVQYGCRYYGSGYTNRIEPSLNLDVGGYYNPGSRAANNKMTISYWIRIVVTSSLWRNVFTVSDASGDNGNRRPSHWIIPDTRRLHSSHRAFDGASLNFDSGNAIPLTTFTHICEVVNGMNRKFYVDGVLRDDNTFAKNHADAPNSYRVYCSVLNPTDFRISLLRFFPYSFTGAQVTALYNSETGLDKGA